MNKGLFSSKRQDWETPQELFDELNEKHDFNIDVCATRENTKCQMYFSPERDGLSKKWLGNCWMNPPYGREINKWILKAYQSAQNPNVKVVGLLPARTDTKWFHKYILGKANIRFLKGRLKFSKSKNSAPFPSMIVTWGMNCKKNNTTPM